MEQLDEVLVGELFYRMIQTDHDYKKAEQAVRLHGTNKPKQPYDTTIEQWNEYAKDVSEYEDLAPRLQLYLEETEKARDIVELELIQLLPRGVTFHYQWHDIVRRVTTGERNYIIVTSNHPDLP